MDLSTAVFWGIVPWLAFSCGGDGITEIADSVDLPTPAEGDGCGSFGMDESCGLSSMEPMDWRTEAHGGVRYSSDLSEVDWEGLKTALAADRFDNGRSPEQLRRSFENSHSVCLAWMGDTIVGTARVLSDGICNAYLVDMWTSSKVRRRGIAREMMRRLTTRLSGQHVYLQADDDVAEVYRRLGFHDLPIGMEQVVGQWLVNDNDELT